MPIQITAKRDGFRRCGIAHSETTTTYPDGHFTDTQVRELEAEPNLVVIQIAKGATDDSQQLALVDAGVRIADLEAVVLQLNTNTAELQVKLDSVTAERDELAAKLVLLTATGAEAEQTSDQVQDTTENAAQDTGAGDDKKSDKKKG